MKIRLVVIFAILALFIIPPRAQAQYSVTYMSYEIADCEALTSASLMSGQTVSIIVTSGYEYFLKASNIGMLSMPRGTEIPTDSFIRRDSSSDISYENASLSDITVIMCKKYATSTPTSTPTSATSLPSGCIRGSYSTGVSYFMQGSVISMESGAIDYGGIYGTAYTPIPDYPGSIIIAPGSTSYTRLSVYLRGSGVMRVCARAAATVTPTPTITPLASGCRIYASALDIHGANRLIFDDSTFGTPSLDDGSGYTPSNLPIYLKNNAPFYISSIDTATFTVAYKFGPWSSWSWPSALISQELFIPSAYAVMVSSDIPGQSYLVCTNPTITSTETPISTSSMPSTVPPTRTPVSLPPGVATTTNTPTRTTYPTPVSMCVQTRLAVGVPTSISVATGTYIRALNGIALADGTDANYSIDSSGIVWPESSGSYPFTAISVSDGGTDLVLEICPTGQPAATATSTAPALPCAVADRVDVPVSPGTASLTLQTGTRFVVAGAAIWLNIGAHAREIQVGNYTWSLDSGTYTAYSVTTPATIWVCVSSAATAIAILGPTWTPGPEASICVAPATAAPAQTGQIPSLSLIIPTLAPLPTITVTIVLSASLVVSPAQTMVSALLVPAQGAVIWCQSAFGLNGFARAQTDAAPIVVGVASAFGWITVIQEIGPLAWIIPALLITILIRAIKPVISIVKYVKQIIPFQ